MVLRFPLQQNCGRASTTWKTGSRGSENEGNSLVFSVCSVPHAARLGVRDVGENRHPQIVPPAFPRGQECPRHTRAAELRSAWTAEGGCPHVVHASSPPTLPQKARKDGAPRLGRCQRRARASVPTWFNADYLNCFISSAGILGGGGKSCDTPLNNATVFSERLAPSCTAI